jgi:ribonuclease P protein component
MHEREAHVPTEHPPPGEDARVSGADEHKKRSAGAQTAPGERPKAPDRQQRITHLPRFRPHERIRRRAEFQEVYERGARIRGRYATVFVLANHREVGRLGIAATKKLGGAVQRNRAKRLIREVFRRNNIASGFDVVVVPKREMLDATLTILEDDYRNSLERRLSPHRPDGASRL